MVACVDGYSFASGELYMDDGASGERAFGCAPLNMIRAKSDSRISKNKDAILTTHGSTHESKSCVDRRCCFDTIYRATLDAYTRDCSYPLHRIVP